MSNRRQVYCPVWIDGDMVLTSINHGTNCRTMSTDDTRSNAMMMGLKQTPSIVDVVARALQQELQFPRAGEEAIPTQTCYLCAVAIFRFTFLPLYKETLVPKIYLNLF